MTIIAIRVPLFFSLKGAVKTFVRAVQGYFEVLNFAPGVGKWKLLYLRLSPKLDAKLVVHRINGTKISTKFGNYQAHIPDPDNVPADLVSGKKKHIVPLKLRLRHKIPAESTAYQVVQSTHLELLTELQAKFTGLYNLSKKSEHQLLVAISQVVRERLECIATSHQEAAYAPPSLGRAYRRAHPHFGDFQMILSTLHKVEDAARKPRTQVLEDELAKVCDATRIIANSYESPAAAQDASNKYSKKIIEKLSAHISGLQCEPDEGDSEEEAARKLVRAQLRRIAPYLPEIIRGMVVKNLVPKSSYQRVNIYGEPNLPPKALMDSWLKPHRPLRAFRVERAYNCLSTHIPDDTFPALVACDGDTVGPSKLVIRMMDHPVYTPSGDPTETEEN